MNLDILSTALCCTLGATVGWYVGRQRREIARLQKRNVEQRTRIEEQRAANERLLAIGLQLAEELAHERSDDWWKGEG